MLWAKILITISMYLLVFNGLTFADQDSEIVRKGQWGLGFYGAGGTGVTGGIQGTEVVWSGVRYKRIFSDAMGKGFLRGSLEYGAEFMPVFLIFQNGDVVYGTQFSPLLVRWNFQKAGSHILPYFECGAGLLYTADQVPLRSSNLNFTPQGGLGLSIFSSSGGAVTFQVRYMHISNGSIKEPNPGINSVQFLAGYEWLH